MKNIIKLINRYLNNFFATVKLHDIYLKIFLTLLLFFWIFYLSIDRFRKEPLDLKVGDIAPYDIKIKNDIEYTDEIITEAKRNEAISRISPIFQFDMEILENEKKKIDDYFKKVEKIDKEFSYMENKIAAGRKARLLKDKNLLKILFLNYKPNNFHYKVKNILNKTYNTGITGLTYDNTQSLSKTGYIIKTYINKEKEEISIRANIDDIYYADNIKYSAVVKKYYSNLRWDKAQFLQTFIKDYINPNIFFDRKATDEKIVNAINLVKPVVKRLKKGQIVVRNGQEINESHFKILKEIVKYSSETNMITSYFIILIVIFIMTFLYFKTYADQMFNNLKTFVFLLSLIFLATTLNYFCPNINNFLGVKISNSFFIPISGVAILISQLAGSAVSVIILFIISILTAFISGFNFIDFITILSVGFLTVLLLKLFKKKVYMWYAGILIGIYYFILTMGISGIRDFSQQQILYSIMIGFINALASVIISMGLFPLFESIFKILTEDRLLELSDLNLPIMKKLLIEAPGTYNHSILIANLAETASLAIGANSLLARVGGYYHDVGKLENAEYFIENHTGSGDKHKEIKPSISSSIIKSHIPYGIELGRRLKLPKEVIDIIQEHHGTTTISYFYSKALDAKIGEKLNKDDLISKYRYEGPQPSSKEAAIIMLADIAEAAARSLKKPSYSRLEIIVRELINDRFLDGQLDHCPLTLIDLNEIANSFLHVLSAMYHTRIKYPDKKKVKEQENED